MTPRIVRPLAVAACTLALASPVLAQSGGPSSPRIAPGQWAVDGSFGLAVPVGSFGSGLDVGPDVMGSVEYRPAATGRIYFRGEIGYSRFGYSSTPEFISLGNASPGDVTSWRFAADGLYDIQTHSPLQVYALAGLGLYHVTNTFDFCGTAPFSTCSQSSNAFGLNFGAGLRYPVHPLQLFFELRYQLALSAPFGVGEAPYFPFQFGVRYLLPR